MKFKIAFPYLCQRFFAVLSSAMQERSRRSQPVPNGMGGSEIGWIVYERSVMYEAVNAERRAQGLPDVTLQDVLRVENMAVGHSDYQLKFALYCAELTEK